MTRRPWNHTIQYHDLVLSAVPAHCELALDVGCGTGLITRELAQCGKRVIGIDLDREALTIARAFPEQLHRIEYLEGDVMSYAFPPASFDFISAVATLHHLPLRPALARFRDLIKPGGTLAVIGLYRSETLGDAAMNLVAMPVSRILRVSRGCSKFATRKHAPEETLADIRNACDELLPGAMVRRRLLFRYSLIWRKP